LACATDPGCPPAWRRRAAAAEASGSPWYQAISDRVSAAQPSSSRVGGVPAAPFGIGTPDDRGRVLAEVSRRDRQQAGQPAGRNRQIRPLAGRGPAEQRPGERPGAQQLAVDGGRGRHGESVRVVPHQLRQPVGADVRPSRVTGHRDLERLDRTRWLPPRCAGVPRPARRRLLGGVPDRAARAEGVVQARGQVRR